MHHLQKNVNHVTKQISWNLAISNILNWMIPKQILLEDRGS